MIRISNDVGLCIVQEAKAAPGAIDAYRSEESTSKATTNGIPRKKAVANGDGWLEVGHKQRTSAMRMV